MNAFLVVLAELAVIVSIAILVAWAARPALRRWGGARLGYAAWSLIPLTVVAYLAAAALPTTHVSSVLPTGMRPPSLAFAPATSAAPTTLQSAHLWLAIYVVGVVAFAIWLLVKQRRFVRFVGALEVTTFAYEGVPVCLASTAMHGPFVWGLLRPTIVLPRDFATRYDETEQRLVLAHERTHVRSGDLYINAYAALLQIVLWFNPLVHWAAIRMRLDQELACDEVVLQNMRSDQSRIATYAQAVLKSAHSQISSPIVCHWQARHPLNERIQLMTMPLPNSYVRRFASAILASILTLAAFVVFAATERAGVPSAGQYRIDFLYVGTTTDTQNNNTIRRSEFSTFQDAGKLVTFKPAKDDVCELRFAISPMSGNNVQVPFSIRCDEGDEASSSKLVTALGTQTTIRRSMTDGRGGTINREFNFTIVSAVQ